MNEETKHQLIIALLEEVAFLQTNKVRESYTFTVRGDGSVSRHP